MHDNTKDILNNYKEIRLNEENINKRAFAAARQIVRKKLAEARGDDYAKLIPSSKAEVDNELKNKVKLVNKIARVLIPKIRKAQGGRDNSFTNGNPLLNQGKDEYGEVREGINTLFTEKFAQTEIQKDPDLKPKPKAKKNNVPSEDTKDPGEGGQNINIKANGSLKPAVKHYQGFSEEAVEDEDIILFFEDYMTGSLDTPQLDALLRLGLVPEDELTIYRRALLNPENAVKDPYLRPRLVTLLRKILDLTVGDQTIYGRLRSKFGFGQQAESIISSLNKKSTKSGIVVETLLEVFDRGLDAWSSEYKVSQQQYAFARVNSYINKGRTYFNEDADLHEISPEKKEEYLDKAIPQHGFASFTKRHSSNPEERLKYTDVERRRRAGIKNAVKTEETDPEADPENTTDMPQNLARTRRRDFRMVKYTKPDGTPAWRKFRPIADIIK